MPELPEVETIKRELLAAQLVGKTIMRCIILRNDVIGHPSVKCFARLLRNTTIKSIHRRAKYLIFTLDSDKLLIFHLRLSGSIILRKTSEQNTKFARIVLIISDDRKLIFDEPRVLGRIYLLCTGEKPAVLKGYYKLSHEPLSPEFDFAYFKNRIKNRRKAVIKSLLLDQSFCAGIGNIYSDEALFKAGIGPLRRAGTLKHSEIFKLLLSLKHVLRQGILHLGTSVSDYKRPDGSTGGFQNLLNVYGREGEPCRSCGTPIAAKKLGNRTTRFCPKCQKYGA